MSAVPVAGLKRKSVYEKLAKKKDASPALSGGANLL